MALGMAGTPDSSSGGTPTRAQKIAKAMGTKMWMAGQKMQSKSDSNKFSASDAMMNFGASSLNGAVRKVMPRASYNASYYRRRKNMI